MLESGASRCRSGAGSEADSGTEGAEQVRALKAGEAAGHGQVAADGAQDHNAGQRGGRVATERVTAAREYASENAAYQSQVSEED